MRRRPVQAPTYLFMGDRAPKLSIFDPDDTAANQQQDLQAFREFISNELVNANRACGAFI